MKRLRLSVFRSAKHIYAQIIDDEKGETLAAVGDLGDLSLPAGKAGNLNKTEKARKIGKLLAEKALKKNVKEIVFDRRNFRYHGRVKALAEGAREGGLKF